jgi:SulP family sulfate permease
METEKVFYPKILSALRGYDLAHFGKDLVAGIIVAVIAIPLSIAFGIGSGVSPAQGLLTAIVAGFLISALGGSRVQIGGPTGAFVVIVYGIVEKFGVSGLIIATLMAGVILILMGVFKLGNVIKFIPQPIIVGFTAGIAVVIFSGEIKDALGLAVTKVPADFVDKMATLFGALGTTNWWALGICLTTLAAIMLMKRFTPKLPGAFIVLVGMTLAATLIQAPVTTIGTLFGTVSLGITPISFEGMNWKSITQLIGPAFSIAFLGSIESLLSAVVADGMIGGKHRSNTELIAQGIANIGSALVGGIPATGAIARTAANVRSGGRTPVAGMTHAIVLLVIMVFFARWASYIPMAVLAAILINVAVNMGEWHEFRLTARTSRSDAIALVATFLITIFVDLVFAIGAGLVLSAFFFIRQISQTSTAEHTDSRAMEDVDSFYSRPDSLSHYTIPAGCRAIELNGAFFFGAATKFEESIRTMLRGCKVIIIRFTGLDMIDTTGIQVLKRITGDAQKQGIRIIFTEIPDAITDKLHRSGLLEMVGRKNLLPTMIDAITAASVSGKKAAATDPRAAPGS